MLQNFRDKLQGIMAKVLVALIIVPFAMFGVETLFSSGGSNQVAEVNGESIDLRELQQAINDQKRQLLGLFGDQLDPALLDDARLRTPALNSLVQELLFLQEAAAAGLVVGDNQLATMIQNTPAFQEEGSFSRERLEAVLLSNGWSPARFKEIMQNNLLLGQLAQGLVDSDFILPSEQQRAAALEYENRSFMLYTRTFDAAKAQQASLSDVQLQGYYAQHPEQFLAPEQVKLRYLELTLDQFLAPISDDAVRVAYESELARTPAKTLRHAAHILVEINDQRDEAQALSLAEDLQRQLQEGADFASLAAEYSDDLGSKTFGGDLGPTDGTLFPEVFETALASLEPGAISAPVRTEAGFHLIQLVSLEQPSLPSFEERRAALAEQLQRDAAEPKLLAMVERIADQVFNAEDLGSIAAAESITLQESEWFARGLAEQSLLNHPKVQSLAFSSELLAQGMNSDAIEISPDHYLFIRVAGHRPTQQRPFEEVRDEVMAAAEQEQIETAQQNWLAQLRSQLEQGLSVDEAGIQVQSFNQVTRHFRDLPAGVLEGIFASGNVDGTVVDGDAYVWSIEARSAGTLAQLDTNEQRALVGQLEQTLQRAAVEGLRTRSENGAEIVLY